MSVKRQATTELNHNNWDQEDSNEPEDTEGFKVAPKEVLEKRVIRTAKRRSNVTNTEGQKSVFTGFGGFNKTQKTSFDFLANLTNGNKLNSPAQSSNSQESSTSVFSSKPFSISPSSGLFTKATVSSSTFKTTTNETNIFGKSATTSPGIQFPIAENTNENQNNSPFKIQTTSDSPKSLESKNSPSLTTTTSNNVFLGSTSNLFSKAPPFQSPNATKSANSKSNDQNMSENKETTEKDDINDKKLQYYKNIKGLNLSVSDWIRKHLDETPVCILTPIFKDYEKYLKKIQDEYFNNNDKQSNGEKGDFNQTSNETKSLFSGSSVFSNTTLNQTKASQEKEKTQFPIGSPDNTQKPNSGFMFNTNVTKTQTPTFPSNSTPLKSSSGFSFGSNTQTTSASTGFSFGINSSSPQTLPSTNTTTTAGTGNSSFSFGVGKPFTFNSNIQKKEDETDDKNTNEDEDEPPKVEFTPLVEKNSVFDKKCKIFFKKDGNFVDKGVGTLYIKKIENSEKHQLLVRANTSLGNILLNLVLSSSIPTQRMGKNNVMLVCIPTPDAKPPPTPVLIRVKTGEEADDLFEILNKYKV